MRKCKRNEIGGQNLKCAYMPYMVNKIKKTQSKSTNCIKAMDC